MNVKMNYLPWTGQNHREMFNFLTYDKKKDEPMMAYGDTFEIDHNRVKGGLCLKIDKEIVTVDIGDYVCMNEDKTFRIIKPPTDAINA